MPTIPHFKCFKLFRSKSTLKVHFIDLYKLVSRLNYEMFLQKN